MKYEWDDEELRIPPHTFEAVVTEAGDIEASVDWDWTDFPMGKRNMPMIEAIEEAWSEQVGKWVQERADADIKTYGRGAAPELRLVAS